jgi:hypothetical protein
MKSAENDPAQKGGFRMPVVGAGVIGTGQAQYLDVVLEGGRTYSINVLPSEAGVDFDLHIYDQNGNLVSWDETPAADAHGTVMPIITGPFRIVVNSGGGMAADRVEIVG